MEYLSEADEESEQEVNEMVDEVTNIAARDLVNQALDFVRKESLDQETITAAASEVIKASRAVQELTASEVENLVLRTASEVGAFEHPASEDHSQSETLEGNPLSQSIVAEIVTLGSSSDSPSSSSSIDSDDIPLSRVVPSLRYKIPSPSTKPHKEPATNAFAFIPVYESIEARTIALQQTRINKCKNLPEKHPLQPPVIEAIQSIPASAKGASDLSGTCLDVLDESVSTPNSPTPTPNNNDNQTFEQSVISNIESHCSGELPEYQPQMTSDITSDEVVIESPSQQQPNKNIDHINISDSIPLPEISVSESEISVSKQNVYETDNSEPNASDQHESEQTTDDQTPSSSNMFIEPSNQIFSEIPKPPSFFLNLPFLATVCFDIFKKAKKLIETRQNLVHEESYE